MKYFIEDYKKTLLTGFGISIVILIIISIIYTININKQLPLEELHLELTEEQITIEIDSEFIPNLYLKNYTKDANLTVSSVNTNTPGTIKAIYTLTRGDEEIQKELIVEVIADFPTLILETEIIEVPEINIDSFACTNNVIQATDFRNNDIKERVLCENNLNSSEVQIIKYKLMDNYGQSVDKTAVVKIIPNKIEQPVIDTDNTNNSITPSNNSNEPINTIPNTIQTPNKTTFLVEEYRTFDACLSACVKEANASGISANCLPLEENDIYIGYRLEY
jgi:hypothetical protein